MTCVSALVSYNEPLLLLDIYCVFSPSVIYCPQQNVPNIILDTNAFVYYCTSFVLHASYTCIMDRTKYIRKNE